MMLVLATISLMWHQKHGNRNKNKQVGLHHSKKLFIANRIPAECKGNLQMGEYVCNHLSSKELTSQIYKELLPLNRKKKVTKFKMGLEVE